MKEWEKKKERKNRINTKKQWKSERKKERKNRINTKKP